METFVSSGMHVINLLNGKKFPVDVLPVEKRDYKSIRRIDFYFNWRDEAGYGVYKLVMKGDKNILGLISVERFPMEWRLHIRLLCAARNHVGKNKIYDRIAGNLMAYVAKLAVTEFGVMACLSLRPKTSLQSHYCRKYRMNATGTILSLEVPEINNLINEYCHE